MKWTTVACTILAIKYKFKQIFFKTKTSIDDQSKNECWCQLDCGFFFLLFSCWLLWIGFSPPQTCLSFGVLDHHWVGVVVVGKGSRRSRSLWLVLTPQWPRPKPVREKTLKRSGAGGGGRNSKLVETEEQYRRSRMLHCRRRWGWQGGGLGGCHLEKERKEKRERRREKEKESR